MEFAVDALKRRGSVQNFCKRAGRHFGFWRNTEVEPKFSHHPPRQECAKTFAGKTRGGLVIFGEQLSVFAEGFAG